MNRARRSVAGRRLALVAGLVCVSAAAFAQRLDPRTPQTLVVGPPRGPSPTARGDGARRGLAAALPASPRVAWRKTVESKTQDKPLWVQPLVRASGGIVIAGGQGDLLELDASGVNELRRVPLATDTPVSAAILSDDAVVVATGAREVLIVRGGVVAFRRRYSDDRDGGDRRGEQDRTTSSILPLDDGGAVIAWDNQLISVDRDGSMRARASLPAPVRGPLVALDDTVLATLSTSSIVTWYPGAEIRRAGRFTGPISGTTPRVSPGHIVAVVDGQTLARFDVGRGASHVLVSAPPGTTLGAPSATGSALVFLAWQAGRSQVVETDLDGRERRRVQVSTSGALDAGSTPPQPVAEVLVDADGRVAFLTPEGIVGVVDRDGSVKTVGETVCMRGARRSDAALVASGAGFLVACSNGTVLGIE